MATTPNVRPGIKPAVRPPAFRLQGAGQRERHLKMLVYGNYGVGKTILAAGSTMVPSMQDVLMISAEAGDLSVEGAEGLVDNDHLDIIQIRDFRSLGAVNNFLIQHCKARDADDEETLKKLEAAVREVDADEIDEPRRFNTVILDSLSELEAYCFNQLLGITDATRLDEETQSAEWTEYKKNHTMILRVVRAFRDLPMHVIFTAGEKYTQDETKKFKYTPDMTGQLAKKVQGFMDMVGYYVSATGKDGGVARRLYVIPSPAGRYDAKHRYATFKGEFFDNPTISSILKQVGLMDKDGVPLK